MNQSPHLAIDAMGGDHGPTMIVAGIALALKRNPDLRFTLFGSESAIRAEVGNHPGIAARVKIVDSPDTITGDDKPSQAIRRIRTTSMGMAISAVKDGSADAAVSAGNTGAMMAMAKLTLRTIDGIDRPALSTLLPTLGAHDLVMLDLGANTECDAANLVQFAVMGAAYARIMNGIERPSVRLLNIGTEDMKGTDALRDAAAQLRAATHLPLRFDGFIESDRLGRGETDVVVSDGFSGNIALKTMEGTARFVTDLLRRAFTSSFRSKAGFLLSKPALHLLRVQLDPNNHNGAVFLGLKGIVVKSHGSANADGIAKAVEVASKLAAQGIGHRIVEDLALVRAARPAGIAR